MKPSRRRGEDPVLITEAPPNPDAAFAYRRRRYALTMGLRVVCLLLAAAFYRDVYVWPIFAAGAVVLPWVAVVLANDRLRAEPSRFQRYVGLDRRIDQPRLKDRDLSRRSIER